jgi:hypothetical protein
MECIAISYPTRVNSNPARKYKSYAKVIDNYKRSSLLYYILNCDRKKLNNIWPV